MHGPDPGVCPSACCPLGVAAWGLWAAEACSLQRGTCKKGFRGISIVPPDSRFCEGCEVVCLSLRMTWACAVELPVLGDRVNPVLCAEQVPSRLDPSSRDVESPPPFQP